ncbi:MAG: HIT domain-containing protein [Archaeoglobaceae archaeon]|nr:HIT domain-containing protein [Archaeoglobaceae archaeon]MDW7990165.1 HIT domain-containing protein [Archaeoglobaceae archaeon]
MERIFAPWRIRYILAPKPKECVFCSALKTNNKTFLVVYRANKSFIMMNRNPYNPGHVMVCSNRHVPSVEDLDGEEMTEIMNLISLSIKAIKNCMNPDGFNIGINIGKVAGAGIAEHLHVHVVPRWNGDTSFMPVLADVQIIPEALEETYEKLRNSFYIVSNCSDQNY